MPESVSGPSVSATQATTGPSFSPTTAGKGGGSSGSLPKAQYPMTPYWMQGQQVAAPSASSSTTPAINPSQGAGRFMGATGLMGGRTGQTGLTPTPTPVTTATRAPTTFRPAVTPDIYNQWMAYNAEKKRIMNPGPGDPGWIDLSGTVGYGNPGLGQGAGG